MIREPARLRLVRDLHSGAHLDLFLVSAVASVLLIRFYLRLAGYPTIGGATLHIAHMLWGGLLMLAALIILLAFLGRASRGWAALLGGVGFGAFIDEVGKFVTRDNDYFYRPAVALIYVVFIAAYLVIRTIRRRPPTREEYVINALQELEQAALQDLEHAERDRALRYLARAGRSDPLAAGLAELVQRVELAPSRPPGLATRASAALLHGYRRLTAHPAFWKALVVVFALQLAVKLLHVLFLVLRPEAGVPLASRFGLLGRSLDDYTVAEGLQMGSSLVSAALVTLGILALRRSRQEALRLFQRAILVSIFITQVFMFYRDQWEALVVLAVNLLILLGLGYMRAHERPES